MKRASMRTVGLFEAKQKLSELVERAREGEKIGITRRGELAAVLVPVPAAPEVALKDIFKDIEKIRKRAKLGRGLNVRDLIEEGRT
jgi:prevent-host-death family protein